MARLDDPSDRAAGRPLVDFEGKIAHDGDLGIWYVCDSTIPGLNAEASTFDELVEFITDLAPDLVAINCTDPDAAAGAGIPLRIEHLVHAKPATAS